ncbi:MAG: hypothetical protein JWM95_5440 [Gemmatimonadetes bacterium]|nr:hypothetical protein [Gemmatimonadota bacterium]
MILDVRKEHRLTQPFDHSFVVRVALAGTLFGCGQQSPSLPPAPPNAADVAPPASLGALSRFSVPLEYDFTAVMKLVDQVVPRTFGSIDSVKMMGTDSRKHYAFEATRGPFTAFADGNQVHLRATIEYKARGFYKPPLAPTISAGCGFGAEKPRIVVELATPLGLTPNWHLVSHARVVSVAPASSTPRDHCDVSMLHKDVTPQVVEAATAGLAGQLRNIDSKVGKVDLTSHVTEWWGMLARPIRLADGVWLVLGPERLRAGKVSGRSKILVVPVSLDARPRIVTGAAEPVEPVRALPPLARDSVSDGYHIVMDGVVDYVTASREMTSALGGKKLEESGKSITVNEVGVVPLTKGRVAFAIAFTGDATGKIRLIGTPLYDRLHQQVLFPDLDFDLDTDSKVLQTYSWLRTGNLRKELRKRARIPVTAALDKGRALLLDGLNRKIGDAVTLSATVDSVAVRTLFVTRDGLVVRAEARGHAGVSVRQR